MRNKPCPPRIPKPISLDEIERELAALPARGLRPWTETEVALLLRSRISGVSSRTLAQQWPRWFGWSRTMHAIEQKRTSLL